MADALEEDIIIIEDSDAAIDNTASDKSVSEKNTQTSNKKKLIYIGAGVGVVLIIVIVSFVLSSSKKRPKQFLQTA